MQIILLKAIFLLAFVAFLRLGEILIRSKAHSDKVLQILQSIMKRGFRQTLILHCDILKILRQANLPFFLLLPMGKTLTCAQYKLYMNIYNCLSPYRAPFSNSWAILLLPTVLCNQNYMLLQFIGLDHKCYKGHSFRIGAGTNAVNMGFSEQYIRKLGQWNSNAIQKYTRISSFNL
jgi:hypothetical protein